MSRIERAQDDRLELLRVLEGGSVEVVGQLPYSSNYVFLARVTLEGRVVPAVYKPRRGERPLWDFPGGTLAAREVAAYLVAEAAGWPVVPPTVMRADAPLGAGSLQVFIEHDPNRHFFVLVHERAEEMVTFAALDIIINNADRKAGHIIQGPDGRLWGVDHGLSFNIDPKLRTVIWAFADRPISDHLRAEVERLGARLEPGGELEGALGDLLAPEEIAETRARLELFLREGVFPGPEGPFSMPWPLV